MPKTKVQQMELDDLKEKLKTLDEKNKALQSRVRELMQAEVLLRQILQKCKKCGRILRLIDWNEKVYILACDYAGCPAHRTPVANIRKKDVRFFLEGKDGVTESGDNS